MIGSQIVCVWLTHMNCTRPSSVIRLVHMQGKVASGPTRKMLSDLNLFLPGKCLNLFKRCQQPTTVSSSRRSLKPWPATVDGRHGTWPSSPRPNPKRTPVFGSMLCFLHCSCSLGFPTPFIFSTSTCSLLHLSTCSAQTRLDY